MIDSDQTTSSAARTPKARRARATRRRRPTVRPSHVASIAVAPWATTSSCSGMPIGRHRPRRDVALAATRYRSRTAEHRCERSAHAAPTERRAANRSRPMMTVTDVPASSDRHPAPPGAPGVMLLAFVDVVLRVAGPAIRNHALDPGADAAAWSSALSEARALRTAREAARRVPAYRDHLERHGIDPARIRSLDELPGDGQGDLHRSESAADRAASTAGCRWSGTTIDESSGSTGTPYNWVRGAAGARPRAADDRLLRALLVRRRSRWSCSTRSAWAPGRPA